ncbi:MAG TPA: DUF1707 domain-containing protein, partial [Pseudonocardiaceae bacterium]
MGESQSPDLRIGDAEREEALKALGEHMSVGRLDVNEYGERAAQVTAAKTRGELISLFADLPEPHPVLDRRPDRGRGVSRSEPESAVRRRAARQPGTPPPIAGAMVPLSGILALVLFFSVPGMSWLIFLLPAAAAVIVGAIWGGQHR